MQEEQPSAGRTPSSQHSQQPLPGRFEGRCTAGGVEETDERWPDSLLPSCRSLDTRKALSLRLRVLLASSGRPTAPKHTTQLIELIYVYILLLQMPGGLPLARCQDVLARVAQSEELGSPEEKPEEKLTELTCFEIIHGRKLA